MLGWSEVLVQCMDIGSLLLGLEWRDSHTDTVETCHASKRRSSRNWPAQYSIMTTTLTPLHICVQHWNRFPSHLVTLCSYRVALRWSRGPPSHGEHGRRRRSTPDETLIPSPSLSLNSVWHLQLLYFHPKLLIVNIFSHPRPSYFKGQSSYNTHIEDLALGRFCPPARFVRYLECRGETLGFCRCGSEGSDRRCGTIGTRALCGLPFQAADCCVSIDCDHTSSDRGPNHSHDLLGLLFLRVLADAQELIELGSAMARTGSSHLIAPAPPGLHLRPCILKLLDVVVPTPVSDAAEAQDCMRR